MWCGLKVFVCMRIYNSLGIFDFRGVLKEKMLTFLNDKFIIRLIVNILNRNFLNE